MTTKICLPPVFCWGSAPYSFFKKMQKPQFLLNTKSIFWEIVQKYFFTPHMDLPPSARAGIMGDRAFAPFALPKGAGLARNDLEVAVFHEVFD